MGVATRIAAPPGARASRKTRVMVVDDSLTVRSILSRILDAEHDIEVVGKASSAELALAELDDARPHVVLLDLEMPGMGGMKALPALLGASPQIKVLVVSSLTTAGAESTLQALSMGAADTMPKPQAGEFAKGFGEALVAKVRALGQSAKPHDASSRPPLAQQRPRKTLKRPAIIGIGASTGGIHALNEFVRTLPQGLDAPILVTQHLPSSFIPVFASQLQTASKRNTLVAESGMEIRPNHIYVAPGTGHLSLVQRAGRLTAAITQGPMPSGCTPSVDPMLTSLATVFEGRALAVILSGMGRDGAIGAQDLVDAGGTVLAQDEETSAVWGMPRAVAERGLATAILPPDKLALRAAASLDAEAWK
ncbi:chemotaxis-specific protein-glutamate methyltransferase CheB [Erythrobacter sp. HKB08]|uniref:chemotaxis-specific protein-glutamate methyltransferase CheB n=1 Tax=Erythrobacter sp. HKB08 TaxID=2502843 RepID=UPI00210177E4|nr:chemotaxis-specific protein-glutamate methyltransferase CheB [Erythrobacter sp. HKB08]